MLRTPTTNAARRTRDRILDSALELFNERGSAAVTTNHIAAHAAISPGNLYYWFRDKDELVRELYARLVGAYEEVWGSTEIGAAGPDADLDPDELLNRLTAGAVLSHRYAFLGRELLGLLHGDPILADEYRRVSARRTATFALLARAWRSTGVLLPLEDQDLDDLVQALWVIAETWLAVGELDGSYVGAADGERLLRVVLDPYLTRSSPPTPTRGAGLRSRRVVGASPASQR